MVTELAINKLYEISGWSSIPAGMKPVITFKGIAGTMKIYADNKRPALPYTLAQMVTDAIDNVTADKNFQVEGMPRYIAFADGTATRITGSPYLEWTEIGSIT